MDVKGDEATKVAAEFRDLMVDSFWLVGSGPLLRMHTNTAGTVQLGSWCLLLPTEKILVLPSFVLGGAWPIASWMGGLWCLHPIHFELGGGASVPASNSEWSYK